MDAKSFVEDGSQIEPSPGPGPRDCPQFVCYVKDGSVVWTKLWMGAHHLKNQEQEERARLIQWGTAPFEVPEEMAGPVEKALHRALAEFGYFIPRAEWERRYPSQALMARRFAEFNAACDAHEASGAEGRMPFEPRWIPFMEAPDDHERFYGVKSDEDGAVVVRREPDGSLSPLEGVWDVETAMQRCRLHNSGWTPDEVDIHMREEPLD